MCALAVVAVACGKVDAIEHEPSTPTTLVNASATTAGTTEFGGGEFQESNFPEPALTLCGDLADHTTAIDGLRSAWGVVAIAGATDQDGDVLPGTIRLRLSEQVVFDCQDTFVHQQCPGGSSSSGAGSSSDGGRCGWGFAFTLAPNEVFVGQHPLADLVDPEFELATDHFVEESLAPTGELELYRVTPQCIVGELTNVVVDDVTVSGGFVAQLCDRRCLPGPAGCVE